MPAGRFLRSRPTNFELATTLSMTNWKLPTKMVARSCIFPSRKCSGRDQRPMFGAAATQQTSPLKDAGVKCCAAKGCDPSFGPSSRKFGPPVNQFGRNSSFPKLNLCNSSRRAAPCTVFAGVAFIRDCSCRGGVSSKPHPSGNGWFRSQMRHATEPRSFDQVQRRMPCSGKRVSAKPPLTWTNGSIPRDCSRRSLVDRARPSGTTARGSRRLILKHGVQLQSGPPPRVWFEGRLPLTASRRLHDRRIVTTRFHHAFQSED